MKISGSKIALPKGNVLGAAFYEAKGIFFVQQNVLSTEKGGLIIRSRRQLSSWSLKSHSMITKRVFDEAPAGTPAYPCGRVEISAKLHRVFICSAGSDIEVIDPGNLSTVGTLAQQVGQHIIDFAVDDLRDRLIVLASRGDGSIRLITYSLLNGDKQHETVVQATNATRASIAFASKTGQIGIAIDVSNRSGDKADIYTCATATLVCTKVTQTDAVSQFIFWERQILAATSNFADNKKECILTVDPATRIVSREYCSPSTGVHYAVGVVENKYVVAFTGMSKRNWFREENRSVVASFSVWRVENSQVAAVAPDPTDYGSFQDEVRIVGSNTESLFIAYQRISNSLSLYSITDPN